MATDYPSTLPVPQTANITPFERAQLSNADRPREARALSTDRLATVRATWPPLSPADAAVFRAWWKDEIYEGGAWFNATWPLPQGTVEAVFRFIQQPRWRFVPGGRWRIEAVMELRGRTQPVIDGSVGSGREIAWFDPINDPVTGALLHSNSGTGVCDSFAPGPVVTLFAGLIGWVGETLSWSLIWDSVEDASPIIAGAFDNYVQIDWVAVDGSTFPVSPASIGSLIVTTTVDGTPIAVGQRLIAVTTPPTGDYPDIAWGPE
jgi:hypothetical protein